MIIGHGVDTQDITAVEAVFERRPNFLTTILTEAEQTIFEQKKGKHRMEFLAGRFSAKEAFSKALGTGIGSKVSWHDLEIMPNEAGQPIAVKYPKNNNNMVVHISISHSKGFVHSSVIIEQRETMPQPVSYHRDAWIEISAANVKHNIDYIRELTHTERFFAVVKANAYGHGLLPMVTAIKAAGVEGFAVATLDEGIWLRNDGVTEPILVLGVSPVVQVNLMAEYNLMPVVASEAWMQAAIAELNPTSELQVWLAVDTGMGRIGFRERDSLERAIETINANEQLVLHSIGMHFATADEKNSDYFEQQLARWHAMTDGMELPAGTLTHAANSATSLWYELPTTDLSRVGAAMYGFDPSQGQLQAMDLRPVLSLRANLTHVKHVAAGQSISYGATYTTTEPEWIGTLPIGYADGYVRSLQGMDVLLPDGRRAEIVGRIAMDQMMVRLPEELPAGTTITLIGRVGDDEITLVDLANKVGTIPYEIATELSVRLPRKLVD